MQVVQAFTGSTIVQVIVRAESDEIDVNTGLTPIETLKVVEAAFIEKVTTDAATLGTDLGAPVKQIVTDEAEIVPTAGNEDISDLTANSEFMSMYEDF